MMMDKCEAVYADTIEWEKVDNKIWEKTIWKNEKSGTYVRLVRAEPGFKGQQVNVRTGKVWHQGMLSSFPAETEHGPFSTDEGILCIEFRYYRKP